MVSEGRPPPAAQRVDSLPRAEQGAKGGAVIQREKEEKGEKERGEAQRAVG